MSGSFIKSIKFFALYSRSKVLVSFDAPNLNDLATVALSKADSDFNELVRSSMIDKE
jgi:hypothetical protein